MIKPGLYEFKGKYMKMHGINVRHGHKYIIKANSNQIFNGESCVKVYIASRYLPFRWSVRLYPSINKFREDWERVR